MHTSNNQRSYYQSDASNPTTEIVKTHRDKPSQTKPRSYAEILKPQYSKATTHQTRSKIIDTETRINQTPPYVPSRRLPLDTKPQYYEQEITRSLPKNGRSPRPRNMEGGMQELLSNTMQAFELLQNTFTRLVDLRMTHMDESST